MKKRILLLSIVLFLIFIIFVAVSMIRDIFQAKRDREKADAWRQELERQYAALKQVEQNKSVGVINWQGYSIVDAGVFYRGTRIDGADKESFRTFLSPAASAFESPLESEYAVDKNHAYFEGRIVLRADVATFQAVASGGSHYYTFLAEDKNHVFFEDKAIDISKEELFSQFLTFPSVGFSGEYSNWRLFDGKLYYHESDDYGGTYEFLRPLRNFDVLHIQPFLISSYSESLYITDGHHVFCRDTMIVAADPDTFRVDDYSRAHDKDHVFFDESIVEGADPETFEQISNEGYSTEYFRDREHVYLRDQVISSADPATFQSLSPYGYARDSRHVFYKGKVLSHADEDSFHVFSGEEYPYGVEYARDKNTLFFRGDRVVSADPQTISFLGSCGGPYQGNLSLAKDIHNVYSNGKTLSYLQPDSVALLEAPSGFIRDANTLMDCNNMARIRIDAATFRLEGGYFLDKNGVYFGVRRLSGVNPTDFHAVVDFSEGSWMGFARDNVYNQGSLIPGFSSRNLRSCGSGYSSRYFCNDQAVYSVLDRKVVTNLDPAEFEMVSHDDKDHEFRRAVTILEGRENVRNVGANYFIKDGCVWYGDAMLPKADIETFQVVDWPYGWAEDVRYLYRDGKIVGE